MLTAENTSPPAPPAAWQPAAVVRFVPVLSSLFAVLLHAPGPLTGVLVLLSMLVVCERVSRIRALGAVDEVLVGVGGILVTLIGTGLLLGVSRIGLRPVPWAAALAALALIALVLAEWLAPHSRPGVGMPHLPGGWASLIWGVPSTAVVVVALLVSVRATDHADVAPMQMSLATVQDTRVDIRVVSDRSSGPLELRTQASDGTSVSYPLFSLQSGQPVTTSVVLPENGRFVITLNNPDQSAPLRTLILER